MNSQLIKIGNPPWFTGIAAFGILWNAYGVYQFIGSLSQTAATLMQSGLSTMEAELYLSLPTWMGLVFGVGVWTGIAGSIALFIRNAAAPTILGVSLMAYLILFAGDAYFGLFALPSQLAVLSFVVAVAITLFGTAILVRHRALVH